MRVRMSIADPPATEPAMGAPTWVARTQVDWAESLLDRGRLDDARRHAGAAALAIGDLLLAESRRRLAGLTARFPIS